MGMLISREFSYIYGVCLCIILYYLPANSLLIGLFMLYCTIVFYDGILCVSGVKSQENALNTIVEAFGGLK